MAENSSHVIQAGVVKISFDSAMGVSFASFEQGAMVSMDDAHACTKALFELLGRLNGGRPAPMLVDFKGLKRQSKDVRDYFASDPTHTSTYTAVAILVDSALTRVIANFFIGLNKIDKPARLFDERQAALDWLAELGDSARVE